MELRIRNGRAGRLCAILTLSLVSSLPVFAQNPSCAISGTTPTVHAEGIAERLGDITFVCTGATPGAHLSPTIFLALNIPVTNIVDANGNTDVALAVDAGSGFTNPGTAVQLSNPTTIAAQSIPVTVPSSGQVTIRFQNIRGAVGQLSPAQSGPTLIQASAALVGGFVLVGNQVVVGLPSPGLLTSFLNNGVPCTGSPAPATNDLPTLFANATSVSVLRVTEGYAAAFSQPDPLAKNGIRIVVSLSGYGPGARVFVPDGIVGNSGSIPTGANAFGFANQAGVYIPGGGGSLLLARVNGADANGAGGTPAFSLPLTTTTFSSASEVTLTNGAATVTYEVLDGIDGTQEDAHIPVFVAVPQSSCTSAAPSNNVSARLGPVSTVLTASATAPVPRFISTVPGSDCTVLGDCGANYYPRLSVDTTPVALTGASLGAAQTGYISVSNLGAGLLTYKTSVTYPSGATGGNWLSVTPGTAVNTTTLQLTADPGQLAQGVYSATVVIDAAQYGIQRVPVTFTVGTPGVTIQGVVSAATFAPGGPLAPGSIAALFGLNLSGTNVTVTFDGLTARVFGTYTVSSGQQINLLVPDGLGTKTSAKVLVTVDGRVSNSFGVTLTANAPGIFNPGILNQNFTVNAAGAPIKVGSYVYVFMTGLATPLTGPVTVKIGSMDALVPQYAGPAPTLSGVQQINVQVPSQLTFSGNSTTLAVCVPSADPSQQTCSPPATLYVTQ